MSMAVGAFQPTYGNAFGWGQPQFAPAPVAPQVQMGWDQYQAPYGQPPAQAPVQYAPQPQPQPTFAQALNSLWDRIAGFLGLRRQPQPAAAPQAMSQHPAAVHLLAAPDDVSFLTGVYRQILGREPDAAGFNSYMTAMRSGLSRQGVLHSFMASPEYQQRQAFGAVPAVAAPPPAPISEPELHALVINAAKNAMAQMPGPVARLNQQPLISRQHEMQIFHDLTGLVIAELQARGLPVERLARHLHQPIGSPSRYVNDAIVLPDGRSIDIFGGDGTLAMFHDLQVPGMTDRGLIPRGGALPHVPGSALPQAPVYSQRLPLHHWGSVVHFAVRNEKVVNGPLRVGDRIVLDSTPHVVNPDPANPRRMIEQPKEQQDPRGPIFRQVGGPPVRFNPKSNPYLLAVHPTVPGTYEFEVSSRNGEGLPGRVSFTVLP